MIINHLSFQTFIGSEVYRNDSFFGSIQDIVVNLETDTFFFMIKPGKYSSTKQMHLNDLIAVPWKDIVDEEKGYTFNVSLSNV